MVAQLRETAEALGLEFGDRHMTYNSRKAQELGLWAEEKGCGHAFHMAAFKAYFAKGLNIARRDVLLEIITQAGLNREEGAQIMETREYADRVDADWELSYTMGIKAAPTFVMGENRLVGAQSYPVLRDFVLENSGGSYKQS